MFLLLKWELHVDLTLQSLPGWVSSLLRSQIERINLAQWGISPLTSKIIATIFGFIGNFVLRRYLVFPEKGIAA